MTASSTARAIRPVHASAWLLRCLTFSATSAAGRGARCSDAFPPLILRRDGRLPGFTQDEVKGD